MKVLRAFCLVQFVQPIANILFIHVFSSMLLSVISVVKTRVLQNKHLMRGGHDGGLYHIETSPLICRANHWTVIYMIGVSVVKELNHSVIAIFYNIKCCKDKCSIKNIYTNTSKRNFVVSRFFEKIIVLSSNGIVEFLYLHYI